MGNWNSSQITQLDHVLLSTDSVTALGESLLALSKHLVSRIDTLWAARQQAVYYTALSNTPETEMPQASPHHGLSPYGFSRSPRRACAGYIHFLAGS